MPYRLIGRAADVGFVTPHDAAQAADLAGRIDAERLAAGRERDTVHVFADLVVLLDDSEQAARSRLARLDETAGTAYRGDAEIVTGTAAQLADLLADWQRAGVTGFRLRPATIPYDLTRITRSLVPELQRRGLFRTAYPTGAGPTTLRALLGLPRPANRYATA